MQNTNSAENKPDREDKPGPRYHKIGSFQISQNLLVTYLYLFSSILMNIINRVLYQKYNFKFNFTLLLIQQLACLLFFKFAGPKFKNFNDKVGKISFAEFYRNRSMILFFSGLFILNLLTSFIGNQKVNTAMFLVLRKFLSVMNYLYDLFINKKKLPGYFSQSALLICIGSILTGYNDLTSETIGYVIVFFNNFLSVLYGQISESFSRNYHISNIKLLIYNGYVSVPILFVLVFITGEYEKLLKYQNYSIGFFFTLFISCAFTLVLNSSYFISNERNSSLFTQLFSNCKVFSHLVILGHFYLTFCTFYY